MMTKNQKNFRISFQIDLFFLRENFYAKEFTFQKEWFVQNFEGSTKDQIHKS